MDSLTLEQLEEDACKSLLSKINFCTSLALGLFSAGAILMLLNISGLVSSFLIPAVISMVVAALGLICLPTLIWEWWYKRVLKVKIISFCIEHNLEEDIDYYLEVAVDKATKEIEDMHDLENENFCLFKEEERS